MSRFNVQTSNMDEGNGTMNNVVDDLPGKDEEYLSTDDKGATRVPLEIVSSFADERFYYDLHKIQLEYPIPYEAMMAGHQTFYPTPPVYSYSEWWSTEGEEAVDIGVFTRQEKFEPGRTFPVSSDCLNVYKKFLGDKDLAGPPFPWIAICPKFAHLQNIELPLQGKFPTSRTLLYMNRGNNRAWISYPEVGFLCRFETCCTERCIVALQRIGEVVPNHFVPL